MSIHENIQAYALVRYTAMADIGLTKECAIVSRDGLSVVAVDGNFPFGSQTLALDGDSMVAASGQRYVIREVAPGAGEVAAMIFELHEQLVAKIADGIPSDEEIETALEANAFDARQTASLIKDERLSSVFHQAMAVLAMMGTETTLRNLVIVANALHLASGNTNSPTTKQLLVVRNR